MGVREQLQVLTELGVLQQGGQVLVQCLHVDDVVRSGKGGTNWAFLPVRSPVIGHSLVCQHILVISKLFSSIHKKSDKLRKRKLEHVLFILLRSWRVILVPDTGYIAVRTWMLFLLTYIYI